MSQVTHGIRALLTYPPIYDLFQRVMGAKRARSIFSSQYIRAREGDYVLDIGCGTAEIRNYLPHVEYYGFDPSAGYIEAAKNRLREVPGCTLLCASVDEAALSALPKFDIVLAIGVIHHLNDEAAVRLADLAKTALKQSGRLVTLDPCFIDGQSFIARYLVSHDRGQNVRNADAYRALMATTFDSVESEIRHDLPRFPYTHLIMECAAK
jgi:SAM-dependent methyltransferase